MPTFFASDIHLRPDRPDRGERLARWLATLNPGADEVYLVGDVCDFWFASRQRRGWELPCGGLRALADFTAQGGALTILPGNHDAWLGPYYERALGARWIASGEIERQVGGLRILATHGHLLGARPVWKHAMESRAFLRAFSRLPDPMARTLERRLDSENRSRKEAIQREYLELYRSRTAALAERFDLVVLGHIHKTVDLADQAPRLVVLGDWKAGASFLKVDEAGATFHVVA